MSEPREPTVDQLTRRLERERKARREAERITEDSTTRLYGALEELKSLNQALRDIVAVASHDLGSPITVVAGYANLLRTGWDSTSEDEKLRFVEVIERQANNLMRLAEDLLTVSRIEAGALDTQKHVIELGNAVAAAMQPFFDRVSEISIRVPPELRIEADPNHVERILVNYIGNAIKYGSPPIEIVATRGDGWVEIRVRDYGEGVPSEFVPRLFARFARAEGTTMAAPGTGLGLSIVRGLALANGGDAWYEPNAPRGSCFAVRLPAA
jgi:signal transduction histidine kinase